MPPPETTKLEIPEWTGSGLSNGDHLAYAKDLYNIYSKGDYTPLADFPEQHEVSAEETGIFDAAVNGYPMIHARAMTVASRALPNGTEYLFTAEDLPREDKPDMPPAGKMQVYVTVANGQAPVFTKVIR